MRNILVVNVNWLGDVIFSTPVFKNLKAAYPDASITCLAHPRVVDIADSCPYVDEVIAYDEKTKHFSPLGKLLLILELRKKHFDGAFVLHRSWTRAMLVFLSGIPIRVGYVTKRRGFLLTHPIQEPSESLHRADYYLHVLEAYGVAIGERGCELCVEERAQEDINRILAEYKIGVNDPITVVNTGGNWDLKRWPHTSFEHLLSNIDSSSTHGLWGTVVIPGAGKDSSRVKEIISAAGIPAINLAGKTTLKQLIALMKRADLVITADSGPLHIASAVGTKTVALFGPTRPERTGPRGPGMCTVIQKDVGCNHDACYHLQCPDNICMKAISAYDVLKTVEQIRN